MKQQTMTIAGMTCGHCVMSVKKELSKVEGVLIHSVSIGSADITIDETKVTEKNLKSAVEEAGYSVTAIQ